MTNHNSTSLINPRSLRDIVNHHKHLKLFVHEFNTLWKETIGKVGVNGRRLLYTKGLIDLGLTLGTSFLSILIWRKTQNLSLIVIYNVVYHVAAYVAFNIPIFLLKIRKASFLRLGIVFYLLTFTLLAIYSNFSQNLVLLLALLQGLGSGAFWVSYHSLNYENTDDDNRDKFFAMESVIGSVISIISPIILSLVFIGSWGLSDASLSGAYLLLFILTIVILTFAVAFSFRIPSGYFNHFALSDLTGIFKDKTWTIILSREAIGGFKDGTEGLMASLLLFSILASEFNISVLSLIFSVIGILISFRLALILGRNTRLYYAYIGSVMLIISRIFYVKLFSLIGIIVSASIELFATPLFGLGLASTYFDAMDHSSKVKRDPLEYIYIREVVLMFSRVFGGLSILFLLRMGNDLNVLKSSYLLLGFIPFVYFLLTWIFEWKFKRKVLVP